MKPKNFPGRKKQRQIDAKIRTETPKVRDQSQWTEEEMIQYHHAFNTKTKKDRRGLRT